MDKIKGILVGCGGISQTWLRALGELDSVDLVAMVDIVEENAQERAAQFGYEGILITDTLEKALELTGPEVVFNCTIPDAHYDVSMTALESGCHVLTEKPLASSMQIASEMVSAAEDAQRILAVIQNRRYHPHLRRLRYLLETGRLGQITTCNSDFYLGAHFGGFRDQMEHVLLLDMAIHTFDAARLITGENPLSVYCKEWNPRGSWYDHDASAIAIFEMTNGVVYTYRGSWCAEGRNTSWESAWRVVAENGTAEWDGLESVMVERVVESAGFLSDLEPVAADDFDSGTKVGGHGGVIGEFVSCVKDGGVPETVASDNIKSLAMVFGAIESAQSGRPVEINS